MPKSNLMETLYISSLNLKRIQKYQTTFYILINNISNTYFIINGRLFNNNHKGHKHKK